MPLRDHFRPPLSDRRSWDGWLGQWPAMIVQALADSLPRRYSAAPQIHLGSSIEIDVGTFEDDPTDFSGSEPVIDGGAFPALWAPPSPTLVLEIDLPDVDAYEVLIHDNHPGRKLVAAIEIVSPSNKDRPEHRRVFVAKCATLLQDHVSVTIVDLVTTRSANLYAELVDFIGQDLRVPTGEMSSLQASTFRWTRRGESRFLETWVHPLFVGRALPTMPLWLSEDRAIPLELEASYEATCRVLRID